MHDPEILSVPEDDENYENISTRDALKAPDAKFKEAIRKEVWDLMKGTGTLAPVSSEEVKAMKKYWQIGTLLCANARRKVTALPTSTKLGAQHEETNWPGRFAMPQIFSRTVKPPTTFVFMMQIAVTLGYI